MKIKTAAIAFILCAFLLFSGCSDIFKAPSYGLTQSEEKLKAICKKDYNLGIKTKTVGGTAWVYLPLEHDILKIASSDEKKKPRNFAVLFLGGEFGNKKFTFEYDIVPTTKPGKNYGYNTPYTEEYSQKQQYLSTAIFRVYGDTETVPSEKTPVFLVIVIADIKTGIETKQMLYFEDFRKTMSGAMPHDEYFKRNVFEIQGSKSIVGDSTGKHLEYTDIAFPKFLTEQIIHRINFKYQRSDFQPEDDVFTEIVKIIGEAVKAYNFTDFEHVELHDIRQEQEYLLTKPQILGAAQ